MKVRFVHQYFYPDLSSVSKVISQVCFHLAAHGDEVSVICSRNKYDGPQGDRLSAREVIHGVEIRRCWGPSFGRRSLFGYFLDMASFCVLATIRLTVAPKADTTVFLTNPPLFSLLGAVMKKIRNERFVYVLMDVYPDIAVRSGVLREGSVFTRVLRGIARAAMKGADRVVVLGEDMRDVVVRSGVAPGKVIVVLNWADTEAIYPVSPAENRLRQEWGLDGKFVVEYSGNLGVSHYFEDILAAAEDLASFADIRFAFIGGGVRFREVERTVASKRLTNVILLPYQEESSLAMSLSAGDVHYVSLRPGFEGLVVPSKAYGIMAAGRPIIYQGAEGGEIARMVTREGIGYVISPGDREGLRECILSLYRNSETRLRIGAVARQVLGNKYSSVKGLSLYREVLAGER